MDYTTLTGSSATAGSIANWLNSSKITAVAPIIVQEAESFTYRRLRHWRMLTEGTFTMSTSNDYIALPDSTANPFLDIKSLYITGTNFAKLTMKTEEEVKSKYAYDGSGNRLPSQPRIYYQTMIAGAPAAKFDNLPDQTYPGEIVYYQQPAPLSTSTTNFMTVLYPRLFRCACMVGAAEFMKDVGQGNYDRTYWEEQALGEIMTAQTESDRYQRAAEVGAILQ